MRKLSHPHVTRSFAILCLLLLVAGIVAMLLRDVSASASEATARTPADAVRRFLVAATVDNNGLQACRYLTPAEQRAVARKAGTPLSCNAGFYAARLQLGGKTFGTEGAIDNGLDFSTRIAHRAVTVTISHGGVSRSFVLVPANPTERNEFQAPTSPWRIASGATALAT